MTVYLKDTKTNVKLASIDTNHGMTIDEALSLVGLRIDEDGEILEQVWHPTGAYYDNLELVYNEEDMI